jgi:hypothetical protein
MCPATNGENCPRAVTELKFATKFVIRLKPAGYRSAQKLRIRRDSAMVLGLPSLSNLSDTAASSAPSPVDSMVISAARRFRCQHRFVVTHTKRDFEFVCERCRHRTEELPPVRWRSRRGAHVIPFSRLSRGSGVGHSIHR